MKTSYIQELLPGFEEVTHEVSLSRSRGTLPVEEIARLPQTGEASSRKANGNFSCHIDNLNQFEKLVDQSGLEKEEFLNHVLDYIGTLNRVSKYSSSPHMFTSLGKQIYKLINRKKAQKPLPLIKRWEA